MRWIGVFLAASLFVSSGASAVPITLSYAGYIDQLNDPDGLLDPAVTHGAGFTAEVTLDPAFIAPSAGGPGFTRYSSALFPPQSIISVAVSIGGVQLVSEWDGLVIGNDSAMSPLSASLDFWAPSYPIPFAGPVGTVLIGVTYSDSSALKLEDTSFFVPSDSDLAGWDSVQLLMSEPDAFCALPIDCALAAGTISPAMIPEPTTALLLTFGLAGLGMRRRG